MNGPEDAAAPVAVGIACPACGKPSAERYCPNCGTLLRTRMPTLREFGAELWTELLGLQRRALATLATAITRPGAVTEAYRRGEGSRFVSPLKLYIALSALFFALGAISRQVISTGIEFREARPDLVMALALPVFALWLKLFYGWLGGGPVRYMESLTFAMMFQSALFTLGAFALVFSWLPFPDPPPSVALAFTILLWAYMAWYLWQGARRLWGKRGALGPLRAALIWIAYWANYVSVAMLLESVWPQ